MCHAIDMLRWTEITEVEFEKWQLICAVLLENRTNRVFQSPFI
jgi:hypothetical protein